MPFWPKHLRYTLKALTLDWGDVADRRSFGMYLQTDSGDAVRSLDSRTIILARLPNSLLLSGVAYSLLALIALPTALFLSQREGTDWITPDGREFSLKNISMDKKLSYSFIENVPYNRFLLKNENWRKWFIASGNYPTPPYYVLFANPQAETATVLPGKYTLRLDATLFEEGSDLQAELVLFGQVEGIAGADYLRRALIVPLLWGLPFALMIGGIGAILTTIASLVLAAAGVWLGS